MLAPELHLLQPAQRAQAHVQDRLRLQIIDPEATDQPGLGVVLLADDADHLVQIQEDDQEAVQQLQPPLDRAEAMAGAADQHLAAMVQPGAQHAAQAEHHGRPVGRQHVHVQREAGFQLGGAEQRLHQRCGFDGAGLRLQDQADLLRAFVPDVPQQRQLLGLQQLGQRFSISLVFCTW